VTAAPTYITGIRTVSIPVNNQDLALNFYIETLGFTLLADNLTTNVRRWIELAPRRGQRPVTLEPAASELTRGAIGIRFTADDAEAVYSRS